MKLTEALKHGATVIEDQIHHVEGNVKIFLGRIRGDFVELTEEGLAFFHKAADKTAEGVHVLANDATSVAQDVSKTAEAATGAITNVKAVETATKAPT